MATKRPELELLELGVWRSGREAGAIYRWKGGTGGGHIAEEEIRVGWLAVATKEVRRREHVPVVRMRMASADKMVGNSATVPWRRFQGEKGGMVCLGAKGRARRGGGLYWVQARQSQAQWRARAVWWQAPE